MPQQTGDILAELPDHAALAAWLVRCPDGTIVQECGTIHAAIERAKFTAAAPFVEARRAAAWCSRNADLSLPRTVVARVFATMSLMMDAVRRRDAGAQNDEIVLSRAGLSATPREGGET